MKEKFLQLSDSLSEIESDNIITLLTNLLEAWEDDKIDLSNEDHCGPCGQYALEKVKSKNDIYNDITSNKSN